jgi:hypothetical protein
MVRLYLYQAVGAHRAVRRRGFLIFYKNKFTDGGEAVSLTRRPAALYSQEDFWYSFLLGAESTPGI